MLHIWHEIKASFPPEHPNYKAAMALLDEQILNIEENYNGATEQRALPIFQELRRGNLDILADEGRYIDFSYFIALQWMRTRAGKARALAQIKTTLGVDMSRRWNVFSHIGATNAGYTLFARRRENPITLHENRTGLRLITGDQPVINLSPSNDPGKTPLHWVLYYPISPKCAVFINDAGAPIDFSLHTEEQVRRLNDQMFKWSYFQTFGQTERCLTPYLTL